MLHSRVLSQNPQAGTTEWFHYDDVEDRIWTETVQDAEPLLELNLLARNEYDERARWKGDTHHVASVPLVVIDRIKRTTGIDLLRDKAAQRAFLNDPDNRMFRTRPGRV